MERKKSEKLIKVALYRRKKKAGSNE